MTLEEEKNQTKNKLQTVADEEIGDVASLITRAFRGTGWHTEEQLVSDFTLTEEQLRSQVEKAKPHGTILQWKDGSKRLACVLLRPVDERQLEWRFAWLAIEPSLQTTGLGKTMLESIEDYAQQRGATTMVMNAMNVRQNLISWYQRRGYVLTGEKEPFVIQQVQHGKLYRTDLCFVVLEKSLKVSRGS